MATPIKASDPAKTSHSSQSFFKNEETSSFFSGKDASPESFFQPSAVVQPKLSVGQPGDKYEQEADKMAEKVVQQPDRKIQSALQKEGDEPVISQLVSGLYTSSMLQRMGGEREADPEIETKINSSRGGGQPMEQETRNKMEQGFGSDFSGVRVHTDSKAVQMSAGLGAHAFTTGSDIFFNEGKYNPGTNDGQGLLAHELTHVVQQGAATKQKQQSSFNGSALRSLIENEKDPAAQTSRFDRDITAFRKENTPESILQQQEMVQDESMVGEVKEMAPRSSIQRSCGCTPDKAPPAPVPSTGTPPTAPTTAAPVITAAVTPRDNFAGRSTTRFGVGEVVDLSFTSTSTTPPPAGTGAAWSVASGTGTVVNSGTNDGRAAFTAGDRASTTVLELKAVGGASAGTVMATKTLDIVEPNDALMQQGAGTGIRHTTGMAGVGFKGSIFLRPMDVSFNNVVMREGSVAGVGSGTYARHNGRVHGTTPSFVPFGPGNSATGNQLGSNDTVDTGDDAGPAFVAGSFSWPIPWEFKVGAGAPKQFTTATHFQTIDAAGATSITKKGAGPFTKVVADPTTTF